MATQAELYTLALSQGLTPERARVAAAIAMAESGGNANAHNTNAKTGDNSYGLWQINMIEGRDIDVAKRRREIGISSNEQLFDPATNARAMKVISGNGTNFYPWTTYSKGKHLQYLNNPVADLGSKDPSWLEKFTKFVAGNTIVGPVAGTADAGASAANSLGSAIETLNKGARWVSNSENWLRVGYVAGGAVLVVSGLVMVVQSTTAGRAAMGLIPAGRVANVAKKLK
jgi:hypothetical protein